MSWRDYTTLGAALAALLVAAPASAKVTAGDLMPELASFDLEGEVPELTGRVVVIDVWASWCAPCKASFPALGAFQAEFAERGVTVIGVSVDRNARQYAEFVRRLAPRFATVRDARQRFAPTVEPPAMPSTYVIDRHGRVRSVHRGFHGEQTLAQLRAEVLRLLEEEA